MPDVYDYIVRVSSMGDRDMDAATLADQEARCRAAIEARGGRVGQKLDATETSGWTSVDSPAFRTALRRALSRETRGFAVAYSDRLARNVRRLGRFFDELEEAGADVIFADKPELDYRTPDGRMATTLDGLMAERKLLSDKERAESIARRKILQEGVANQCPYGYRRNRHHADEPRTLPERSDKVLVPDPERATVVRQVFDMRSAGTSWSQMARRLNADGVTPPRGERWTVPTLRSMVANETYVGVAQYKRRDGRHGKATGEVLRNEQAHEPIVPRRNWARAQSTTTIQRTGTYEAGIAGGIVRCHACGGNMVVSGSKKYLVYACRRQVNGGCPSPVSVSKWVVDGMIEAEVKRALEPKEGEPTDSAGEISRLADLRDQARAELDAFLQLSSALAPEDFKTGYASRRGRADEAERTYDDAMALVQDVESLPGPDAFRALDLDAQRQVARTLIEKVVVGPRGPSPWERLSVVYTGRLTDAVRVLGETVSESRGVGYVFAPRTTER